MSTVNAFASNSSHPVPDAHSHDQESCGHTVQFYAEDQSLVAALTRFVRTSLGTGGSAIVIATKPHREALTLELQASGLDTMAAIWQGRFILLDAAETLAKFTVDGWPDAALFTELIGGCVATAERRIARREFACRRVRRNGQPAVGPRKARCCASAGATLERFGQHPAFFAALRLSHRGFRARRRRRAIPENLRGTLRRDSQRELHGTFHRSRTPAQYFPTAAESARARDGKSPAQEVSNAPCSSVNPSSPIFSRMQ